MQLAPFAANGKGLVIIALNDLVAILLAAGASRRFGADDKLLAPLAGAPVALHAARRLVDLAPARLIAVCRSADTPLATELAALGFEIIANPDADRGLSRSLACGIAAAARGGESAALIALADMPFISEDHLRRLTACFDAVHAPIVASTHGAAPMPPAIFARSFFDELSAGEGDQGARTLLRNAALVPADARELADIDRPGDLPAQP